ncbi:septum site-determining protein MinC [Prochlorococcus marinus]|uniref:Probable septum site-determining protein MinC n=1 Tax=Prochlorococcus marinus XMU1408 TaxID=2213228 RepID=A0A318R2P2_PROMR|nr:septum site-determining protein MinC [Prochlorococcus marinus]MBW3041390.1 septum site-determining protein MinC [Prochlorococcus marinus str. XMU1408]PYE02554.1 septum site-determining protein MinC [Prochlorococcus marinus XMU1408]
MDSTSQKIIINIDDEKKYLNWKSCLKHKLKNIHSKYIEIGCSNLNLSCTDILELISIVNQHSCRVVSFSSTSPKTIISSHSLGFKSHYIIKNYSNKISKIDNKCLNSSKTNFHQGTIRSGEYLDSPGDLLILGDVNPGAIVSAEGNIIIWGRLLGIAHAGREGNSQATISALQLRPVQLRIANKVARGPKEKPQLGLAEQARIDLEQIIISPLDSI